MNLHLLLLKLLLDLGFEKQVLKNNTLRCYFVANPDSPYFQSETFNRILLFLQTATNKATLKQVGKNGILVVEKMNDMQTIYEFLFQMHQFVEKAH
jgi:transcription-repair coupling factor (superfamily II helicase)